MKRTFHAKIKTNTNSESLYQSEVSSPCSGSPNPTNTTSDTYDLLPLDEICSSSDNEFLEETDDLIFSQLSPNSKASCLAFNSKRIRKKIAKKGSPKATLKKNGKKRIAWSSSEDERLLELFGIYGPKWAQIASKMEDRTGKQVRDRYLNVLVSSINKAPFTEEEDRVILDMLEEIGNQWCRIAESLDRRTENQVKNRFHMYLKKNGFTESTEVVIEISPFSEKVNDPTDMISYEKKDEDDECQYFNWDDFDRIL